MGLFKKDKNSGGNEKNKLSLKAEFNQSAQQIFGLVLDVEKYPKFIDALEAVNKTQNGSNDMTVEFVLSDEAYNEARSKVSEKLKSFSLPGVPNSLIEKMVPKKQTFKVTWNEFDHINVENLDKPIDGMVSRWTFKPTSSGGTNVEFETDYNKTNFVVRKILNLDFVQAVFQDRNQETIDAVKKQADLIFNGNQGGPKGP